MENLQLTQYFSFKHPKTNKLILFEEENMNSLNHLELLKIIKNKLIEEKLELNKKYVIEGNMGDYIIWENNNIELIGECS